MEINSSTAVLIINWETYDYTRSCLISLFNCTDQDFQVVVIDNGSTDGSGKRLFDEFQGRCVFLFSETNLGFSGGNNVGLKWAMERNFDYVLLLNNDTEVEPDFLSLMKAEFSHNPRLGAVQPMIVFLDDPSRIWSAGGKWISTFGRAVTLGDRLPLREYKAPKQTLDWATGCCLLVKREALRQTGGLNEQYFAYFEDVEWSLRCRKAGFEIGFAESAKVYHAAGGSSKKEYAEGTLSPRVFYYHVRNQFLLLRKELNGIQKVAAISYHLIRFSSWMAYFLMRRRFNKLKAVSSGISEGLSKSLEPSPQWH